MIKKILSLTLVVLMVVGLCSCGQAASTGGDQTAAAATSTAAANSSVSEKVETATAAPAEFKGKDLNNDEIKIYYIPMSTAMENTPVITSGMEYAIEYYDNISLSTYDAQFDATTQISLINEAITQGVDGLIVQCADAAALNNVIEEAEEAGVVVMTMNISNTATPTAHIYNSDYKSAWKAAEYMDNLLGGEGNWILLDCAAEIKETCPVGTGFEDYCDEHGVFNLLESVSMVTTVENGYTYTRDLLTKYPDIDFIYCANDNQAIGAYQAIKEAGRENEGIKLIGYEGQPAALEAIKRGEMFATVYMDQFYEGFAMMCMMMYCISTGINSYSAGYDFVPSIELPTQIVTKDNVDDIIKTTHWDMSAYGY